jgi:putative methionine-R-sulfoxide reductase with GAF domain
MVGDEIVGVLNMESFERANYTPEDMQALADAAVDLAELAQRFLSPGDAEIGMHSRMLSDLVEKFSIETPRLIYMVGVDHVRDWALEQCSSKVAKLRSVQSAQFTSPEPSRRKGKNYRKAADSFGNSNVNLLPDGGFSGEFEVLRDGVIIATLEVIFEARPDGSILDVIRQFCRITGNEIRRRSSELRSFEFERLIEHLAQCSAEELMNRVPACLKRMFECDDVTFFVADHREEEQINLVPWSSTALRLIPHSSEPFYRSSLDDGFTGYASTIDDVLVIRNVHDKQELESFDPEPQWEKKLWEGGSAPLRSYFAVPLRRSSKLVGLIRGHRHAGANNISLSDTDTERLRLVRFLLERVFAGTDLEFGPPTSLTNGPDAKDGTQRTRH